VDNTLAAWTVWPHVWLLDKQSLRKVLTQSRTPAQDNRLCRSAVHCTEQYMSIDLFAVSRELAEELLATLSGPERLPRPIPDSPAFLG